MKAGESGAFPANSRAWEEDHHSPPSCAASQTSAEQVRSVLRGLAPLSWGWLVQRA